jgi:hypothetical protein
MTAARQNCLAAPIISFSIWLAAFSWLVVHVGMNSGSF